VLDCVADGGFCLNLNAACCSNMCVGLFCVGTGNNGNCCVPDAGPCAQSSDCCQGSCLLGTCQIGSGSTIPGDPCVTDSDCVGQAMVCDYITGTCENSFCYPTQQAAPGACGTLALASGGLDMTRTDGTICHFGVSSCFSGRDCCTGVCAGGSNCTEVARW
jgi:hypothetical protein